MILNNLLRSFASSLFILGNDNSVELKELESALRIPKIEEKIYDPTTEWSLSDLESWIDFLEERLQCEQIGMRAACYMDYRKAGIIGGLMQSSPTLRAASSQIFGIVSENSQLLELELLERQDSALMTYKLNDKFFLDNFRNRRPKFRDEIGEFIMAMGHLNDNKLIGKKVPIINLRLERQEPSDISFYQEIFGVSPKFGQEIYQCEFSKKWLDQPLMGYNEELHSLLSNYAKLHFKGKEEPLKVRLKRDILEDLKNRQEVSIETMAERYSLGVRSIQRKLKEESSSFRSVVEECRQELALEFIRDKEINIKEIAFLLNYSSVSSFSRAFRNWTGTSPDCYRKNLEGKPFKSGLEV
ncbi:AraC family transcriptional regulator [Xanthovirga aplysinae]|uniref:AraC family transcriptional regulator n=1 Tax=Xanthovirga aplysinae TaxID=2529853 RepID=UPI0012BB618B|nr:AraC family transcriptional regulator [Xanthovirga aplysinae]MTI32726.1 AraC family transcriptional regulator [Xanthovirga aplysinae]